jgi:hypothetical protein
MTSALQFLGISILLCVLATSLSGKEFDAVRILGRAVVIGAMNVIMLSLAMRAGWALVGGKAALSSIVLMNFYAFAILTLFVTLSNLALSGALRIFWPDYLTTAVTNDVRGAFDASAKAFKSDRTYAVLMYIVMGILDTFMLIGLIVVWGVYHRLNGLSRARSFAAFIMCSIFGSIALATGALMGFGGQPPFGPSK